MALRYDAANRITIARSCHLHAPTSYGDVGPPSAMRVLSLFLLSITYGVPRSPAANYVWCPPIPCCQLRMVPPDPLLSITYGAPRSVRCPPIPCPPIPAVNYVWCPPIPAVNYVWCPPIKTVNCVWCPPIHVPRSTYGVPRSRQIAADIPLLLDLVVQNRVGDRPDRYEPRAVKRRPEPHRLLGITRRDAKKRIERGEIIYERIKH